MLDLGLENRVYTKRLCKEIKYITEKEENCPTKCLVFKIKTTLE